MTYRLLISTTWKFIFIHLNAFFTFRSWNGLLTFPKFMFLFLFYFYQQHVSHFMVTSFISSNKNNWKHIQCKELWSSVLSNDYTFLEVEHVSLEECDSDNQDGPYNPAVQECNFFNYLIYCFYLIAENFILVILGPIWWYNYCSQFKTISHLQLKPLLKFFLHLLPGTTNRLLSTSWCGPYIPILALFLNLLPSSICFSAFSV